ncbi:conserved hypothetical protein [Neospora caninum Liverpool]|uniref:Uncharacterized protein n=1 Tax=Neospora caninum (strain Liverpool) TaxID=572307 RepID=F0VNP1_NEOCL|nr:conserved hypothetical protein [Neospora caninum Liverpool]CBZ55337.1 conserved hypothetical protein [Neospora caninum Liverpool]CEL70072.1 TPA: hypothetical protein BN1204_057600 [Neospora caninum Liverpool]|eukprot:XP_003885365.1 conserved hypothetical protein [Neospora caninum Liverpool]
MCQADDERKVALVSVVADSVDTSFPASVGSDARGDTPELRASGFSIEEYLNNRRDVSIPGVIATEAPRSVNSASETGSQTGWTANKFPSRELSVSVNSRDVGGNDRSDFDRERSAEISGELDLASSYLGSMGANESDREPMCREAVKHCARMVSNQVDKEKDCISDIGQNLVRELIEEFGKRRTNFSVLVPKVLNLVRLFLHRSEMGCWDSPFPAPLPTCAAFSDGDQAKTVRMLEEFYPLFNSQGGLLLCTQGRRLESGGGGKYYFQDKCGRVVGCHKHDLAEYTAQGCVSSPVLLKTLLFCLVLKPLPRAAQRGAAVSISGATGGMSLKSDAYTHPCDDDFPSQRTTVGNIDGTDRDTGEASKGPPVFAGQHYTALEALPACVEPGPDSSSQDDTIFPSNGSSSVGIEEREAQLWKAVLDVKELVGQTERLMSCLHSEAGQSAAMSSSPLESRNQTPLSSERENPSLDAERDAMGYKDSGEFDSFLSSCNIQTISIRTSNPQRLVRVYRSLVQGEKTHTVEHLLRVWSVTLHIHDSEESTSCNSGGIQTERSKGCWEKDAGGGEVSVGGWSADAMNSQLRMKKDHAKRCPSMQNGRSSRHQFDNSRVGEWGEDVADTHSHVNGCKEQASVEVSSLIRKKDSVVTWRPCLSLLWVKPLPLEQSMIKWSRRSIMTEVSSGDCCGNSEMDYTFPSVVSGGRHYDEVPSTVKKTNGRDELFSHRGASCDSTRSPSHPSSVDYTPSLLSPVSCIRGASPGRGGRDDTFQHPLDLASLGTFNNERQMSAWLAIKVATARLRGLSIGEGEGISRGKVQFRNVCKDNSFPVKEAMVSGRGDDWERGSRGSAGTDEREGNLHSLLVQNSRRAGGTHRFDGGCGSGGIIRGCTNGQRQPARVSHAVKQQASPEIDEDVDWIEPSPRQLSVGGPCWMSEAYGGSRGELVEQLAKLRACQMKDVSGQSPSLLSQVQDVGLLNMIRTLVETAMSASVKARTLAEPGAPAHHCLADNQSGLLYHLKRIVSDGSSGESLSHGGWRCASSEPPVQDERAPYGPVGLQSSQRFSRGTTRHVFAKQQTDPSQLLGQRKRLSENMTGDVTECDLVSRADESWKRQKNGGS